MLLDVNVLLALAWPNHQHHGLARPWFERASRDGWATCAITEVSFLRLSSNPAFTPYARTPREAVDLLARLVSLGGHRYLSDLPSATADPSTWDGVLGHGQVTDVYLAVVARHHDTKLATFDGRLARSGLPLARHVHVIES